MKISASNNSKTTVEAGLYPAVCYSLIDIGTQENTYQDKTNYQRKAILKFELLDEFDSDEKRVVLSQIYNMSLSEMSKFRKHLKGWRGRDFTEEELNCFEPKNILGGNVILNVIISDKGRAIIDGMARFKDEAVPAQREEEYFSFDNFSEGTSLPDYISEGIANIMYKSKEWKSLGDSSSRDNIDVPF